MRSDFLKVSKTPTDSFALVGSQKALAEFCRLCRENLLRHGCLLIGPAPARGVVWGCRVVSLLGKSHFYPGTQLISEDWFVYNENL